MPKIWLTNNTKTKVYLTPDSKAIKSKVLNEIMEFNGQQDN